MHPIRLSRAGCARGGPARVLVHGWSRNAAQVVAALGHAAKRLNGSCSTAAGVLANDRRRVEGSHSPSQSHILAMGRVSSGREILHGTTMVSRTRSTAGSLDLRDEPRLHLAAVGGGDARRSRGRFRLLAVVGACRSPPLPAADCATSSN